MKELKWVIALLAAMYTSSLVFTLTKNDWYCGLSYLGVVILSSIIIRLSEKVKLCKVEA